MIAQSMPDLKDLTTPSAAAEKYSVSARTVQRWAEQGHVKAWKLDNGRTWVIDKESLAAYAKELEAAGTAKFIPYDRRSE